MRAVTWTQVAQYIVLIIAYLVPVFWMSSKQSFGLIPQFVYGDTVARLGELESLHQVGTLLPTEAVAGLKALTVLHAAAGEGAMASWKFVTLVLCMMAGTASLPHILMRYFTTPSVETPGSRSLGPCSSFFCCTSLPGACDIHKAAGAGPQPGDRHHWSSHRGFECARMDPERD